MVSLLIAGACVAGNTNNPVHNQEPPASHASASSSPATQHGEAPLRLLVLNIAAELLVTTNELAAEIDGLTLSPMPIDSGSATASDSDQTAFTESNATLQNVKARLEAGVEAYRQPFGITFLGKYSAGKSTMINSLLRDQIARQPSDPPTSARRPTDKTTDNCFPCATGIRPTTQSVQSYLYDLKLNSEDLPPDDAAAGAQKNHDAPKSGGREDANIYLFDSPGVDALLESPESRREALRAVRSSDVACFVINALQPPGEGELPILRELLHRKCQVIVVANMLSKMSQAQKDECEEYTLSLLEKSGISVGNESDNLHHNNAVFFINALDPNHCGMRKLKKFISAEFADSGWRFRQKQKLLGETVSSGFSETTPVLEELRSTLVRTQKAELALPTAKLKHVEGWLDDLREREKFWGRMHAEKKSDEEGTVSRLRWDAFRSSVYSGFAGLLGGAGVGTFCVAQNVAIDILGLSVGVPGLSVITTGACAVVGCLYRSYVAPDAEKMHMMSQLKRDLRAIEGELSLTKSGFDEKRAESEALRQTIATTTKFFVEKIEKVSRYMVRFAEADGQARDLMDAVVKLEKVVEES